jgi:ABC-2 type transport system permease protein
VDVETTISTSDDQIAIAPGSLIKDWKADGRHYFQYKLDHKSWNFYSFISAKYEVARRKFNGIDMEIYYHKAHEYNVERMLNAIEKSLTYYTANFGPYYHKQCRIIEFPRYSSFAQAFPGTMPYSEGIGFIANLEKATDIDMVTYVVAHEMGHQWWAHQVAGANMQGGTMFSETLAQYSALMVMEKLYGKDIMRKFLKYEMDNYLRSRGAERLKEQPLMKVESSQGYIHYRKGSVVMYYLKEMIGEDKVNLSVKTFLDKFKYQNPPFPTSLDLMAEYRKNTPDSLQYILKDLFEDITLFSNRTMDATYKKLADGKYEVKIKVESQKFKADEKGKEVEVPVNDFIEIGALAKADKDKQPKILYRQRVKISQKSNEFIFIVNELPEEAGIDPAFQLIDRMPNDNLKRVDELK